MRRFILDKLFFPKVAIIDRPGIIISNSSVWYSSKTRPKRMVYVFEDNLVRLMLKTRKRVGDEKCNEFLYRIGKKHVAHYISISGAARPPKFLVRSVLEHIMNAFISAGAHAAKKFQYDAKKPRLVLYGSNNLICQHTGSAAYLAGGTSMLMSFLHGRNIEAIAACTSCPGNCLIISDGSFPYRCQMSIPEYDDKYSRNFSKENTSAGHPSFGSLLKFKKVVIDESGSYHIGKHVIAPFEVGWLESFSSDYEKEGLLETFQDSISESSRDIGRDLFRGNLSGACNTLAAFGWGFPQVLSRKKLEIFISNPPESMHGNRYLLAMLQGLVSGATGRSLKVKHARQGSGLLVSFGAA